MTAGLTKIYLWGFILAFCLAFISLGAHAQTPNFVHYTTNDGVASANTYYTLQDSKGYLWIATETGVNRFNGKDFELFTIDEGLADNEVLQIHEDSRGRIWFLAFNGKLSYYDNGVIHNPNNDVLLKKITFRSAIVTFLEDSKGRLWFGSSLNEILMIHGDELKLFTNEGKDHQLINSFLHEDRNGIIWACNENATYYLDHGTFVKYDKAENPISYQTAINTLDHKMLLVTTEGLVEKDGFNYRLLFPISKDISATGLGYIGIDHKGNLWLSTLGHGVYVFRKGQSKPENYLKDKIITHVMQDIDNNTWFCTTDNGLYMVPNTSENFLFYTTETGISDNAIQSIVKDDRGNIWMGLRNGLFNMLDKNHHISKFQIPANKQFNRIKQLKFDPSRNSIWFASDHGMGEIMDIHSPKPKFRFLKETDNAFYGIKSFSIYGPRRLAVALSSGVHIISDRVKKLEFSALNFKNDFDFFRDRTYNVFFDKTGDMWFSNVKGLNSISNSRLITHYRNDALLTQRINDINEQDDHTLVIATDGYGIILYKDNKIVRKITTKDGLSSNNCRKLYLNGSEIWVVTTKGVNKVVMEGNKIKVNTFNYKRGLMADEINDLLVDGDIAYIATNKGLTLFNHNSPVKPALPPRIYITKLYNNKIPISINGKQFFDHEQNNLKVVFSAINFYNHGDLNYQYRLSKSQSWIDTKSSMLEFLSLEPGNYHFEVRAKKLNSDWSAPAALSFTIRTPFWRSPWFILGSAIVIFAIVFTAIEAIIRKQKNKEQQELLVQNRIISLEQQALQAMMNPHFVFNIMNSIQHFINTRDHTSANQMLTGFARLIRKNLDMCNKSFISLEEEVSYLTLYLNLEKLRFGTKLNFALLTDEDIDTEDVLIPSMLLQPFVENAIWHGIMPLERDGAIKIDISRINTHLLEITIQDDGVGIDNSKKSRQSDHISRGMSLTKERINLINKSSGKLIELSISQLKTGGTQVLIKMPIF